MHRLRAPKDLSIKEYLERRYGAQFNPERQGKLMTTCPFGAHKTPEDELKVFTDTNTWYCKCVDNRGNGRFWDLVSMTESMPGFGEPGFDETIEHVCSVMGLELEYLNPQQAEEAANVRKVYEALRQALEPIHTGKGGLSEDNPNVEGELYRGVPFGNWMHAGVGLINKSRLRKVMQDLGSTAFEQAIGYYQSGYGWIAQGVVIFRYRGSQPVGIVVRRYPELCRGREPAPKYMNNKNNALMEGRSFLFGLQGARQSDDPRVYLVEGEFDQLACSLRGMKNVVGTAFGMPSEPQLELLAKLRKHPVWTGDADAGERAYQLASKSAHARDLGFAFLPKGEQNWDPDSFVRAKGTAALDGLRVFSSRQVCMLREPRGADGRWARPRETAARYMKMITDQPTVDDQGDIDLLCRMTGSDPALMRSWLVQQRAAAAVRYAKLAGVALHVPEGHAWPVPEPQPEPA